MRTGVRALQGVWGAGHNVLFTLLCSEVKFPGANLSLGQEQVGPTGSSRADSEVFIRFGNGC